METQTPRPESPPLQPPEPPQPPQPVRPPFNEISVLFPLLTFYTAAYMALLAADFLLRNDFDTPAGLMPVYVTLLGAYAADKEVRRWAGRPEPPRKGSLFVYLWLLMFLVMFIIHAFQTTFALPGETGKVVLQVLGIFFGSRVSKYVHERNQPVEEPGETGGQDSRHARILELVRVRGYTTRADIETALGVPSRTASRLLTDLLSQGLIRAEGEGRGTRYQLQDPKQG